MNYQAGGAPDGLFDGHSQVDRLLRDFLAELGAGEPVPGSGCANALIAAVAANTLSSVAKKTVEHGGELAYRTINQAATQTAKRGHDIAEELLILMERDAIAFAPVVRYRRERKTIRDEFSNDESLRQEIEATKRSTIIPMRVAELSIEIAELALTMLKSGFKAAKGESYAALLGSLGSAESSLYLARFNAKTIARLLADLGESKDERAWLRDADERVAELTRRLRTAFADYLRHGRRDALTSRKPAPRPIQRRPR